MSFMPALARFIDFQDPEVCARVRAIPQERICEQCVLPSQRDADDAGAALATLGALSRGLIHERSSTGAAAGASSTMRAFGTATGTASACARACAW